MGGARLSSILFGIAASGRLHANEDRESRSKCRGAKLFVVENVTGNGSSRRYYPGPLERPNCSPKQRVNLICGATYTTVPNKFFHKHDPMAKVKSTQLMGGISHSTFRCPALRVSKRFSGGLEHSAAGSRTPGKTGLVEEFQYLDGEITADT